MKQFLANKFASFRGGCLKDLFHQWQLITTDTEVLETVSGMYIDNSSELPNGNIYQYNFSSEETNFVREEIQNLLKKQVIVEVSHEEGEFISPIFVRKKADGGYRLILNLKVLNKTVVYKKFKMETISSILLMVRPNMYMAKLDIKDAYYSIPIEKSCQKMLKFTFEGALYQFTSLPDGYTEGPRKFTKILKPPLASLRMEWNILVAAYIDDDLITMSMTLESCIFNVNKIIDSCDSRVCSSPNKIRVFAISNNRIPWFYN